MHGPDRVRQVYAEEEFTAGGRSVRARAEGFDRTGSCTEAGSATEEMSLLDRCAGGLILEAITDVVDTNLVPFADELVSGLTGPQNDVFHHDARFKMLAAGRRFGKTHLSLVQLIVWARRRQGR